MADDKALRKVRAKLDKALEANKNEDAVKLLIDLIKYEPANARWPHKRGDLLRKLGRNDEAIECYAAAVEIYAGQGFIARAVAMAKTVLNLDPTRIDILESVDPATAAQLRARQRAESAPRNRAAADVTQRTAAGGSGAKGLPRAPDQAAAAGSAPKRHPMVLDDDAPAAAAPVRHPMVLDDDAPPAAGAPKRHPMVLDDDAPPAAAAPVRHPMVLDDDAPLAAAAPRRSPMVLDDAPRAAPPTSAADASPRPLRSPNLGPIPRNAAVPAASQEATRRGEVTLDKLSLPPPVESLPPATRQSRTPLDAPDIYDRALGGIDELQLDPSAPPNETRFSNAPPRMSVEVDLSEIELAPRQRVPKQESLQPEPPEAAILAKLPLFPLFGEVPKEALTHMIEGSELIELEHGSYVMRRGDPGDALYGIVEGSVDVAVPGQQVRVTLAEGDVFGEACLLQDEPCHADAVVEGKLVALRVPRDTLITLLQIHPPLAELLLELLTRRLLGNLLQGAPLFQEFDAAGRLELARLFEIRRAPAGTMLAVVGKKMDGLYISLTGMLSVNQPGAPERFAPPGSMFGQQTLLTNAASQVDVCTCSNMIVLRLPTPHFTRVAMQYPTMLERLSELATSDVVKVTI